MEIISIYKISILWPEIKINVRDGQAFVHFSSPLMGEDEGGGVSLVIHPPHPCLPAGRLTFPHKGGRNYASKMYKR